MNKKLLLLATLLLSFGVITKSNAQCVPDLSLTMPGVYPDSATGLAIGNVGSVYAQTIQVVTPATATISGTTVTINNFTVTGVAGLPPGLSYACNPASCVFNGGTTKCVQISGTPTTSGIYPLSVSGTIHATLIIIPVTVDTTVDYYSIRIDGGLGVIENNRNMPFDIVQNTPNPFSQYTQITYTTPVKGNFTLRAFDIIGKEVYSKVYKGQSGANTIRLDAKDFLPGLYLYTLSNGTTTLTKRMVVTGK